MAKKSTYQERVEQFKRRLVTRALRKSFGVPVVAAELLGMERSALYQVVHRCGLKFADFRVPAPEPKSPPQRKAYFGVDVEP